MITTLSKNSAEFPKIFLHSIILWKESLARQKTFIVKGYFLEGDNTIYDYIAKEQKLLIKNIGLRLPIAIMCILFWEHP